MREMEKWRNETFLALVFEKIRGICFFLLKGSFLGVLKA